MRTGCDRSCHVSEWSRPPAGAATCASPNLTHDSAGRTATWNGWTFGYDADGRMVSACKSPTGAPRYDTVTFAYDGAGHRHPDQGDLRRGCGRHDRFRLRGRRDHLRDADRRIPPSGTVVRRYAVDGDGSIVKVSIPGGEPEAGDCLVTWNCHGDALNLPRLNADGTTTLANSYAYSSGVRRRRSPTTASATSASASCTSAATTCSGTIR